VSASPLSSPDAGRRKRDCGYGDRLTVSVVLEVRELVAPLRDNSKGIFDEGYDDQETANGWEVSGEALGQHRLSHHDAAELLLRARRGWTHGLTGSESVSRKSSILLVCSRI
jgi:hypothetical protein